MNAENSPAQHLLERLKDAKESDVKVIRTSARNAIDFTPPNTHNTDWTVMDNTITITAIDAAALRRTQTRGESFYEAYYEVASEGLDANGIVEEIQELKATKVKAGRDETLTPTETQGVEENANEKISILMDILYQRLD